MAKKTQTKAAAKRPATNATATHRKIVVVVSHAQRAAADAALTSFDSTHGTAFANAFTPWTPGWDGITEPAPDPLFWVQEPPRMLLAEAALYEEAMASLSGIGVRWYEALVPPDEIGDPANTIDSIYASGYNDELPVAEAFAGACAWWLELVGDLPPRDQLP